jgi:cell division protein ZapD
MEAELVKQRVDTQPTSAKVIHFEHPLNERYRFFLRLEYLFNLLEYHMAGDSQQNSHSALSSFLDIVSVVSRTDIKAESLKELDRIAAVLAPLTSKPGIELTRLAHILESVKRISTQLRDINGPIDAALKEEELLKILQLRNNISGGMCDFDLPAYRHWLNSSSQQRLGDLRSWAEFYTPLRKAITIALQLIRASTSFDIKVAENGIFKQLLDPKTPFQLIIVSLPRTTPYYPEFSGSKHRFTVRFLDASLKRPSQTNNDVEFALSCCRL